jgi:four helix bundle protein
MSKEGFIPLKEMEIYQLCRELSGKGWEIYRQLHWQDKKVMGDQFIESTDSVGANFTEGYRRYHYLDRVKFCYNSRGSLAEATEYWLELLYERQKLDPQRYNNYLQTSRKIEIKLNNFIASIYKNKQ